MSGVKGMIQPTKRSKGYEPSEGYEMVEVSKPSPVRVYIQNGKRAGYVVTPDNAIEPETPRGTIYAAPQYLRRSTMREW